MKSPSTIRLLPVIVALLALGLVACGPRSAAVEAPASPTPPPASPAPAATPPPASPALTAAPAPGATPAADVTAPGATPAADVTAPGTRDAHSGSLPHPPELRRLRTWGDGIPVAMALSADALELYLATTLHLRLHDAGDLERVLWDLPLDRPPTALALAPDGATLALAVGERVELRAAVDGALVASLRHASPVIDVAFAPGGDLVAAALASGTLALWDAATGTVLRELRLSDNGETGSIPGTLTSLAFAPDGARIAAGDLNGNVAIWRVGDGELLLTTSVGLRVVSDVAFAPDGSTIAAASEGWRAEAGAIWLWDGSSGAETGRLTTDRAGHMLEPLTRIAFAADGSTVIAGTAGGSVLRWSWPDGALRDEIAAHEAALSTLALVPGGGLLTGGRDGDTRRWNAAGNRIDEIAGLTAVSAVAAGEALVLTGGEDGVVSLWDVSGQGRGQIEAHAGPVNAIALSQDGALLATGGEDGTVRLWSMPEATAVAELKHHSGPVLDLAFDPRGRRLISAGQDGTIRLWAVPGGALLQTIIAIEDDGLSATAVMGVNFTRYARAIACTAYDGTVRRFAAIDGAALAPLETGSGGWLIALAPGPEGALAALDDRGLLWAWDERGKPVGQGALADATAVTTLAGRHLLTAGPAGGLRLWALGAEGPAEISAARSAGDTLAASADGAHAIVGSRRGFVELWAIQ